MVTGSLILETVIATQVYSTNLPGRCENSCLNSLGSDYLPNRCVNAKTGAHGIAKSNEPYGTGTRVLKCTKQDTGGRTTLNKCTLNMVDGRTRDS